MTSNFFEGCLPQVLLNPFLNTVSHMSFFIKTSCINLAFVIRSKDLSSPGHLKFINITTPAHGKLKLCRHDFSSTYCYFVHILFVCFYIIRIRYRNVYESTKLSLRNEHISFVFIYLNVH